jgi:4-hydroxy-3-polyprenylbenzoate decarboxylase
MEFVIGITGASGAIFSVDLLKRLREHATSLILSRWGRYVVREETGLGDKDLGRLATRVFSDDDLAAPSSSGSNPFDAMIILPCSMSTLAKIACGVGDTLITRTAQVALKERRRLVLVTRESPMGTIHLEQAAKLSQVGAIIAPLSPLFYHNPLTIEHLVEHFNRKLLALLGAGQALPWRADELE